MTADSLPQPHLRGSTPSSNGARIVGRYALYSEFAAGGMASVHLGRLLGAAGFARTVAVKRLHPQFAKDPEFVSMFVDEARLAARIRHPNVVQTLDVVQVEHELFLVMDYVHGDSLANLLKKAHARGMKVPMRIAVTIIQHALFGLHAAHDAKSEHGEPLELVHRDMSPHNVLVGVDGVARVLDFGIAKAGGRVQVTRDGQVKGKLSYLAPEQLTSEHAVDRRTDIYAAAATLWEGLTGRRLVQGESDWQRVTQICAGELVPPSLFEAGIPKELDAVVMRGLAKNPADRYSTAREMALALEIGIPHASPREVGDWVEEVGGESLRRRAEHMAAIESHSAANAPASYADEPTLTRSDVGAVIIAESSANRNSAPAAMARSLTSSSAPPPPRATMPSIPTGTGPTGSGARSVRVALSASVGEDEAPRETKRTWVLFPLLLLLLGGSYVGYMRFNPSRQTASAPSAENAKNVGAAHPPAAAAPIPPAATEAAAVTSAAASAPAVTSAPASAPVAVIATSTPTATKPWKPWQPATSTQAPSGHADGSGSVAASSSGSSGAGSSGSAGAAVARECEVPYTIDTQGIRHPKPQCL